MNGLNLEGKMNNVITKAIDEEKSVEPPIPFQEDQERKERLTPEDIKNLGQDCLDPEIIDDLIKDRENKG